MEQVLDMFRFLYDPFILDKNKNIRLISLFSGYDSQALALKYLGVDFEHYKTCEFDKHAIKSLNEIHNTNFKDSNIKELKANDLEIVDRNIYILTYSFPCTDLSLAGNRAGMSKGSGTRSGLLWEVERLLNELGDNTPDILLMENVPQVLTANGWREWCLFLEQKGYSNYAEILNAEDYGIPQHRERCFMVSIKGQYSFEMPHRLKLNIMPEDIIEKNVEDKYFLTEEKKKRISSWGGFEKPLENINNGKQVVATLTTHCGKESNGMKLVYDKYKQKDRLFTPCECFKLMGVKEDDFKKLSEPSSFLYKQAGNSIVTSVMMAIFG